MVHSEQKSARLKGKNILVTGGSRGIGAGIVKRLAQDGARVALTYTSKPDLAEAVLKSLPGSDHLALELNVSSEESVEQTFKVLLEKFGKLDGLVNNAGVTKDQLLLRMKAEDFDQVMQTNLRGAFLCTRLATKAMLKARQGSIVQITSVIGHSGNAGQANYAASKAGIEAFTKSIAQEVGSRNIRLNCVAPGFISTDMTDVLPDTQKNAILAKIPLQKFGTTEDVAAAVSFLLSDESAYITGQTLHVNGGMYM
jgi:3-oxoacyl-[acyl-carrier protein] reductase